mgnify:CR=1 FL=1
MTRTAMLSLGELAPGTVTKVSVGGVVCTVDEEQSVPAGTKV